MGCSHRGRIAAACLLAAAAFGSGAPALADAPNAVTAYVQPMSGCQTGRLGIMYCQSVLGPPALITADPGTSAALWANTGYALCWTTSSGAILPPGSSCSASGTAIASGNNFAYANTAQFPMTFDGSSGSGCRPSPNNNGNSFFFNAGSLGTCVITISAPEAAGFTATRSTFTLTVGLAPAPTITGSVTAVSGRGVVGSTAPLQTFTCKYEEQFDMWTTCPGVVLEWTVLSGSRVCRIKVDRDSESEQFGSVGLAFRKAGRCTVQGTYPAMAGSSTDYATPVFVYRVSSNSHR